jgi:hypothetical protein
MIVKISGRTFTRTAGLYTFSNFFLQPNAHVNLNVAFYHADYNSGHPFNESSEPTDESPVSGDSWEDAW